MSQAKLRQCLCEYCTNVSLKLDTVKAVATQRREYQCVITNERAAVRIITCDPKQKSCCYSTCQQCSADLMDVYLQPLRDADQGDLMKWYRWENQMRVIRGQPVSRKCLVTKVGDLATLLEELKAEVKFLSQHLFRADWQHRQFTTLRNATPFPQETVMMVLDFAENFTCQYQQEVQAAHWHHDTVTLHPIVAYYKCPACETTTTESLVFISNDGKHDFHAVQAFMVKTVDHLQQERGLTINHIVQWTDGCAAQYKSKGPFADISRALEDFGATLERNFFGSRHGKGPSDGESAVVKNHMMTAIVAENAVVTSAEDVYNYLQGSSLRKPPPVHGCSHFLRTFFWVPEGTINRDRPDRPAKTVKGTRMFHSVKCVEQGQIQSRHLTCTCHPCMSGIGDCTFLEVVGPWSSQTLCPQARQRQPCVPQPRRQQPRARRQQPPGRRQQPRARRVIVLPDVAEPASPPPSDNDEHASPAPSDHDHASPPPSEHDEPASPAPYDHDEPASPASSDNDEHASPAPSDHDHASPPPSEHDEPASPAPYDHAEPASPAHDEPAPSDHDEPASPASYDHVESASPAHDEPVNADHDEPASPAHDEPDSAEPAIFMDLGVPVNTAPSAMDQEGITAPKRTVTKGDWLRVVFHSSKGQSAMEYVAKVLDTDGTETFVSCLRPPYTPRSKQFTYPKEPDETWISRDQITAFLGHPSISRDAYSFDSL
ncbi:uncharacterized protein [Littorina saxatilis]|uniref:Uncharacterized protein n=1 Tax=Littorina saxatilis TaxID=31220 RepID=A0AAN9GF23_9CAEN